MRHDDMMLEPEIHRGSAAMTLANAFLQASGTDDAEERQKTIDAVLTAGMYIADQGCPGQWEAFDGIRFFRAVGHLPPDERELMGIVLTGFFTWLGFRGLIAPSDSLRLLASIRDALPRSSIVADLAARAEPFFTEILEELN